MTSTLAVVDFAQGEMELTNAGHPPTYLVRGDRVVEIALVGHPLGALGDVYGHQTVNLEDGDIVVWLSDGIVEATNATGEPFGFERLEKVLRSGPTSAAEVRDRIIAAEEDFTGGRPAEDDQTLVAMRYRMSPVGEPIPSRE